LIINHFLWIRFLCVLIVCELCYLFVKRLKTGLEDVYNLKMKLLKEKDLSAIEIILKKLNIERGNSPAELLKNTVKKLRAFPYENLTKILDAGEKIFEKKLRTPFYIARDFIEDRTGGTCFSLVYFAKNILDFLGFKSDFVLADRKYGEDTHCAIVVNLEGRAYLVDIGYMIYEPVEIDRDKVFFKNRAYNFLLENKYDFFNVYTVTPKGNLKFRYKIKNSPVSEEEFIHAWEKSFEFEMMNHTVVTKEVSDGVIYLRDRHFHKIKDGKTFCKELNDEEIGHVLENNGLKKEVFFRAKSLLGY